MKIHSKLLSITQVAAVVLLLQLFTPISRGDDGNCSIPYQLMSACSKCGMTTITNFLPADGDGYFCQNSGQQIQCNGDCGTAYTSTCTAGCIACFFDCKTKPKSRDVMADLVRGHAAGLAARILVPSCDGQMVSFQDILAANHAQKPKHSLVSLKSRRTAPKSRES